MVNEEEEEEKKGNKKDKKDKKDKKVLTLDWSDASKSDIAEYKITLTASIDEHDTICSSSATFSLIID